MAQAIADALDNASSSTSWAKTQRARQRSDRASAGADRIAAEEGETKIAAAAD